MSFFETVPLVPPDPILGLTIAFHKDHRQYKINLGVGLYRSEDLQTPVLASVKSAELLLLDSEKSKEYLPIDGDRHYLEIIGSMVFGKELWSKEKRRIAAFQTVGGTGALKLGGTFLKEEKENCIHISTPTWPNHRGVFSNCGLKVEDYPYYDAKKHKIDFENLIACLEQLTPETIVVMHASCHNPTGCDPTSEQWKFLCDLFKAKKLIAFFDFAYQGLGRGIEEDAEAIRHFVDNGLEILVAVSNAKNLAAYGERVGCLFIVTETAKIAEHISSRVKQMIRVNYSNPPMHGAKVAACLLSTPSLREKWENEVKEMRERIHTLRVELTERLAAKSKVVDYSHLRRGMGMFCYTGLTKGQVDRLIEEYAIYMPNDGRINVCGLNRNNLDNVVKAIVAVSNI
jgi:aspartate/tyrosine/aromatic aminotransferase